MKFAIILAGGEGRRAGGPVPKQFRMLCGHPVVWWSMKAFIEEDPSTEIILVLHPGFMDDWDIMVDEMADQDKLPYHISCGGKDRIHSVVNGLTTVRELLEEKGLSPRDAVVAVHDGARPLLSPELIARGWSCAGIGICGVPVVPSVNSLRHLSIGGLPLDETPSVSVVRSEYVEVQTPQTFIAEDILRCYDHRDPESSYTDDASLAEADGMTVRLYHGSEYNMKITNGLDHDIASLLMSKRY